MVEQLHVANKNVGLYLLGELFPRKVSHKHLSCPQFELRQNDNVWHRILFNINNS